MGAAITAGLLVSSQIWACVADEGYHLVATQLIQGGKRPYLDFFYPQVPLSAYFNAGLLGVFGQSWRGLRASSALLTGASVLLVAGFVFARIPERSWRLAAAMTTALLVGLDERVILYGTIAQPYGLCLFLIVAAFRLVIEAVDRPTGWVPALAGLCAGGAAASSLLTAPVVPILSLWMARHTRTGDRLIKGICFLAGAAIPFLPLLWLTVQAPRQALFDVVEYHGFYRWSVAHASSPPFGQVILSIVWWNVRELVGLLDSAQGVLLVLLTAAGLLFLRARPAWEAPRRPEFGSCTWLAGGLAVYLAAIPSTVANYFVLVIPFLAILASLGVYAIGSTIGGRLRPGWLVLLIVTLFASGLARPVYETAKDFRDHRYQWYWRAYEAIGREINRVTPKDELVWADGCTYFAARRVPPSGMENFYSSFLQLPPTLAASLHVVPGARLEEWLAAGRFATVVIGADDHRVEALGLPSLYAHRKTLHGYEIFWDRIR